MLQASQIEEDDDGGAKVVRVKVPGKKAIQIKQEGVPSSSAALSAAPPGATAMELLPCGTCDKAFTSEEAFNMHTAICQVPQLDL